MGSLATSDHKLHVRRAFLLAQLLPVKLYVCGLLLLQGFKAAELAGSMKLMAMQTMEGRPEAAAHRVL